MSRSILLQLARDSIEEVLQSQLTINRSALLQEHPLLKEKVSTTINLFIHKELKASYTTTNEEESLLNNIILCAKKAAFQSESGIVFTTSQYLHCEIELILYTADGKINEIDSAIII